MTYAEDAVPLLAPLPTTPGNLSNTPASQTPSGYIATLFRLGVGVAAGLAVLMIAGNGLRYMMSDVVTSKSAAKDGIRNAVWGLVIALSAYLILNTIGSQYTRTGLTAPRIVVDPTSNAPEYSFNNQAPAANILLNTLQDEANQANRAIQSTTPIFEAANDLYAEAASIQYTEPERYEELRAEADELVATGTKEKNYYTLLRTIITAESGFVSRLGANPTEQTAKTLLGDPSANPPIQGDAQTRVTEFITTINASSEFNYTDKQELTTRANKIITDIQSLLPSLGL